MNLTNTVGNIYLSASGPVKVLEKINKKKVNIVMASMV